jgi:hypothetical protein
MISSRIRLAVKIVCCMVLIYGCGPKEITTDTITLSNASKDWIPFEGNETLTFGIEEDTIQFTGTGKISYFEKVRYMSDQSGFFNVQEDYYADLERQELVFESFTSPYFIRYYIEKGKSETGEWDMIHVTLGDGDYYKNEIRMVIYESDDYPKSENYQFKSTINLNGVSYSDIYYLKQERRPFELYYSKLQGIVGFKLSANELYTLPGQP